MSCDMENMIVLHKDTKDEYTLGDFVREQSVKMMRECLRLEVDERTHSEYTGGYDGRNLYEDRKSIKITLWADIDEQSYKIDEIDFEA